MKAKIAILTALAMAATAAQAQEYEDWARVRSATPEYQRVNVPEQRCHTEYVPVQAVPAHPHAGPIIGGVAGGLLGSAIGKGNGKVAAAAAGAVIGTIVGANVAGNQARAYGGTQPVQRCSVVDRWEDQLTGYRVVYEYAGRTYETLMPEDPGARLRVRVAVDVADAGSPGRYAY